MVYPLAQRFVTMIKQQQLNELDPWLKDALASEVSIRSCVIRLAARFRSMALRLDVSRQNCLPDFL